MTKRISAKRPSPLLKRRTKQPGPVSPPPKVKQPSRPSEQPNKPIAKQRQMGRNQSMSINPAISGGGTSTSGPKVTGSIPLKPAMRKKRI